MPTTPERFLVPTSDGPGSGRELREESLLSLPAPLQLSRRSTSLEYPPGSLLCGVDGGATKTVAVLFDPETGHAVAGEGGPSNPDAVGYAEAASSIQHAVRAALDHVDPERAAVVSAVLGVAGVDTEAGRDRLCREFDVSFLSRSLVVNDVVVAWASGHRAGPGVVAISGTGSNVFGVDERDECWRCGGWGHILGDEGSGYGVGLAALRTAIAFRDERGSWSSIIPLLLEYYGVSRIEDLKEIVYRDFSKARIAGFSQHVATAASEGDRTARSIFRRAAQELAKQVAVVVKRLRFDEVVPISLVGSTFRAGPVFISPLQSALARTAPHAHLFQSDVAPVAGAVWLSGRAAGLEYRLDGEGVQASIDRALRNVRSLVGSSTRHDRT